MDSKTPITFSNKNRAARSTSAQSEQWDLIIIGGGITGAGIALDAVLRGLKVLLLDKGDFASGTSSKSTKLIHGGLRYLKQLEFSLVRESGLERAVAHNNACHLVHPRGMLLPIVKKGSFSAFSAGMAIKVYDFLAKVSEGQRRKKLSKHETEQLEPLLNKSILKSSILYSEYRTDDARLTIELIKAAKRNGAEAFNYMEVADFIREDGKISGVICTDRLKEETLSFNTKVVVNAAGPWVDHLRKADNADTQTNLVLSKGSHIVIDKDKLPITNATYFDVFDGRMVFVIPRGKVVYVGTTDTIYNTDLDKVICSKEDASYLINAVKQMFDVPDLSEQDIQSTWAGLRPLVKQSGKGTKDISRKDEIFHSDTGLISIAGGKLTGFRKMAERVLDVVTEQLELNTPCKTETYKIHHQPYDNYKAYKTDINVLKATYPQYEADIEYLLSTYGKDGLHIIKEALAQWKGDLLLSQLAYTIEYEAVAYPIDFIERRTAWLFFDIDKARVNLDKIVAFMADHFGYDDTWITHQQAVCHSIIKAHALEA